LTGIGRVDQRKPLQGAGDPLDARDSTTVKVLWLTRVLLPRLRSDLDFMASPFPERPGVLIRDPHRYTDAVLIVPPVLVGSLIHLLVSALLGAIFGIVTRRWLRLTSDFGTPVLAAGDKLQWQGEIAEVVRWPYASPARARSRLAYPPPWWLFSPMIRRISVYIMQRVHRKASSSGTET